MRCRAGPPPPDWELLLPPELRRLAAELAQIDAYLDDERFIAPFGGVPSRVEK